MTHMFSDSGSLLPKFSLCLRRQNKHSESCRIYLFMHLIYKQTKTTNGLLYATPSAAKKDLRRKWKILMSKLASIQRYLEDFGRSTNCLFFIHSLYKRMVGEDLDVHRWLSAKNIHEILARSVTPTYTSSSLVGSSLRVVKEEREKSILHPWMMKSIKNCFSST